MKAPALIIAAILALLLTTGLYVYVHANSAANIPSSNSYVGSVRLGVEFNTHATAAWIALNKSLFERNGIRVEKVVKYRTGIELAAAFAHGDVDAAWACLAPVIKMIDKGAKIHIIAAAHYYGYGCVARKGVKDIKQLKRLGEVKVAVTGYGAPTHILALMFMKKLSIHGEIMFIKPPATLTAVLKGYVDIACLPEHYLSIAEYKGLKVVVTAQDVWRGMPGSYLIVADSLLRKNPRVVCALARVNKIATSYALKHLDEAAAIDAKALGIPVSIAKRSLDRLKLTWKINVAETQKLVDYMYKHGIIKHRINISDYVVDIKSLCGGRN